MILPLPLEILSQLSPMRYAVDLMRDVFYAMLRERHRRSRPLHEPRDHRRPVRPLHGHRHRGFVRAERNR